MTDATPSRQALAGTPLWQRLGALPASLAERAARQRLYRATTSELQALGDRDLADLGLQRSQIREVAAAAAQAT